MSDTRDKIVQNVKIFLKGIPWQKILTFSFFVLLATIFWVIQVYRQQFETKHVIPITYTNIPDSIILDNELPSSIETRIKDDGATLFKYFLLKQNDSLVIDVRSLIRNNPQSKIIQGSAFKDLVRSKLYSSTELLNYDPSSISYSYALLAEKKLPVIYDGYIKLTDDYIIDGDLQVIPDSILLYGNKNTLDSLRYAHTTADTIIGIFSDTTITVSLKDLKNVRFSPSKIKLHAPVDQLTIKTVEVPITCIDLPSNLVIKFFPSTVKIEFQIGMKRYGDINPSDFSVIVSYNDIKQNMDVSSIQIRVIESPDYIRSMKLSPSEVEYVIEQQ